MDFKQGIGSLACRLCGAAYQMPIHHLHEPIDVFSEWLDDCEAAQNPRAATEGGTRYDDGDLDDDQGARKAAPKPSKKTSEQNFTDLGLVGDSEDDDDDE